MSLPRRLMVVALALVACSGAPPRHPITNPVLALDAVRARDRQIRSLRAHGSADHFGAQGRIRGSVYIFVQRPDHLRVDTWAFGNAISTLITDGRTFSMADRRHNAYFTGPAEACVAAQLLGIPLEAAEVVAVMAGGPPLLAGDPRIRWDDGHYVLDITGAGGHREVLELQIPSSERERARPDQQHPLTQRAVLHDARGVRAELSFENYRDVAGVPFPHRVRVVMPRDHVDLVVRYDEVTFDPDLPEDAWDQAPLPGMETVPVGCSAPPRARPQDDAGTAAAPATVP